MHIVDFCHQLRINFLIFAPTTPIYCEEFPEAFMVACFNIVCDFMKFWIWKFSTGSNNTVSLCICKSVSQVACYFFQNHWTNYCFKFCITLNSDLVFVLYCDKLLDLIATLLKNHRGILLNQPKFDSLLKEIGGFSIPDSGSRKKFTVATAKPT